MTYDGIYRLTNETIGNDPTNKNGSVSYGLDPVGNRQSASSSLSGVNSSSFTYTVDDETSTDTYDANGNTTTSGGKTFTFDSENHMTSMTGNGKVVTMVYDAFGNRVAKTVNGVTTQYRKRVVLAGCTSGGAGFRMIVCPKRSLSWMG